MSERRWFVLGDDGRPAGPLTTTEIIRALLDERVVSDAKLCAEGTTEWREAHAIEEFRIAAKAVRATVRRRLASDPRSDDVRVPHDEEDIPTRYFTPGAGAAVGAARADTDDDEDVATRYFTPGAGEAVGAARADTDDEEDEVETRYFQQPSAARARAESMTQAAPVVTGPPSGTRPSASVRSVVGGAEDDEDEVKTAYFQHPSRASQPARSPLPPQAPALQPPPRPPVPHAAPELHVTPHPVVASEAQPPMQQPVSLTAPVRVGAQQPRQVLPPTAIGPYARTVTVPPVRSRNSSWVLVIAGLTAFLVALLLASGVAWLMLRQ